MDINTTPNQNAIFSCASNSSRHNVATSCDELLSFPCFFDTDASILTLVLVLLLTI